MGDTRTATIGERGRETFIPDTDGVIVPNPAGRAVKFIKGSDSEIEGLAIPFGGPMAGKDLQGEAFGPGTDIAPDWYPQGRPLLFDHGLDSALKASLIGRQTTHEVTDEGVWARAQLDVSAKYHATVAKLVKAGKLFFSSGTAPQLVEVDADGNIKQWPWMELSLTPTPANPFAVVHAVKTVEAIEHLQAADLPVPAELIASALKALDDIPTDDDALPDGVKFADLIDRLSVDGPAWVKARRDWYAKSGRVLSAATRERIAAHPNALRQLADDLDELLSSADTPKEGKSISDLSIDHQRVLARLLGVDLSGVTTQ